MRPLALLPLLALLACGGPDRAAPASTDGPSTSQGGASRAPEPSATLPEGHNVVRAADGRPVMEGEIVQGQRDGQWTSYTEQGRVKSRNQYVHGVLEGPTIVFYDNGQVRYTGQHHRDKPVGEWRFYDEQGALMEVTGYDSSGVAVKAR